jgi:hypothetical protein
MRFRSLQPKSFAVVCCSNRGEDALQLSDDLDRDLLAIVGRSPRPRSLLRDRRGAAGLALGAALLFAAISALSWQLVRANGPTLPRFLERPVSWFSDAFLPPRASAPTAAPLPSPSALGLPRPAAQPAPAPTPSAEPPTIDTPTPTPSVAPSPARPSPVAYKAPPRAEPSPPPPAPAPRATATAEPPHAEPSPLPETTREKQDALDAIRALRLR